MRSRHISATMSALAAVGLLVGGFRWARPPLLENPEVANVPHFPAAARPIVADTISLAAQDIADNDPFRLSNEPATVRYDAHADGAAIAAAPAILPSTPAPRPALVLRAIIGGPPWQAVIDGLPGQPPGTIVSAGTEVEHLRIASITRDSVVITGADTTWTLRFNPTP